MSVELEVSAPAVLLKSHRPATEPVSVTELIAAATAGDPRGWDGLVDRYRPLVQQVARRYRLSHHQSQDVSQAVWLRLLENIGRIREPLALPGWILTTTKNEALRVLNADRRIRLVAAMDDPTLDRRSQGAAPEDGLLRKERHQAVHDGLAELKPEHRELLLLLRAEPPVSYQEISSRLGMPIGSIGPTRARCLKKLRQTAAIRLLAAR